MADWASTQFVQKHIQVASEHIAKGFADFCSTWYSATALESPLEVIFEIWWRADVLISGEAGILQPQREAVVDGRRYRLDFVLEPPSDLAARAMDVGARWPRICVELDGHEFHERTKEQVAYRNQRDRDLQTDGWLVLHFSESELHRDPMACVRAVRAQVTKAFGWSYELTIEDAERAASSKMGKEECAT